MSESLKHIENNIEKIPIIHYRCSDGPFNRHPAYCLPKHSFFDWCINKHISKLNKKYDRWYIMTCDKHNADKLHNNCKIYIKDLQKYLLEKWNIKTEILYCRSAIEDFKSLHEAPVVMSNISSFSFFASFFSNNLYLKFQSPIKNHDYVLSDWECPSGYVMHDNIKDYKNTQKVLQNIREK